MYPFLFLRAFSLCSKDNLSGICKVKKHNRRVTSVVFLTHLLCFWECFGNQNNLVLFSCRRIYPSVQHEGVWLHSFLTSPINMSCQLCTPSTLHQREGHASTYVVGDCVGTRKIPRLYRESNQIP